MSLATKTENYISEEEYLQGELISDIKHEYINGYVYAMVGASIKHNRISRNVLYGLENSLRQKKSSCETFSSDMKVKISVESSSFFYPDVMVVCDTNHDDNYFQNSPVIIVEVLSKSTRKNDKTLKKQAYFKIPSLEEYVIIDQDYCEIEVFRKTNDWKSSLYFIGDEITFESIDTTLSVESIYYRVENEDMTDFLKEKETTMENENQKTLNEGNT